MADPGPNGRVDATTRQLGGVDAISRQALHRFINRCLRNAEDAEDLAQDAYVRYLSNNRDIRKPLSFLFKIAENLIREYRYRQVRERQFLEEIEKESGATIDSMTPDSGEELATAELLNRVLMQVPEGYRKVLILHKRDRMTAKQIAEKLQLSERTVEHYVARALTYARNAMWK